MPLQIVLNIIIALMWMFLSESYTFTSFLVGYILGIILLFLLRRFVPDSFYMKRTWKFVQLILLFIRELILSNLDILKYVYKPKQDMQPGIFALPIDVKTNFEITLLANLITLTPGTLSVVVSEDHRKIYIHAMDIPDVQETINDIKNSFEKQIMEVTR
ncbi:Na+/H+ antiporter subunit E [Halobacillus litoralis]|uniref:Na+/H+ antiporter subunit E n=1 Tax=Halobacillus litoralis TaxID=45668 RepID=A0A845E2F0_9BACI|nr:MULTISPECIES: Na+/H+ antiporter subunit E [Halobacillus]MCA1021464.1 Na+/H+ antiporter subunit E [Halobacillus litoralis]MYL19854.1 Na+/H+ antiporter subunit E [Halobacillus litoralis]MYL29000.1 Na+/H+ antiporter subunit E [Halobacillus halophilus]MYL37251.1 Na+/H+ antiporter subunit E [Halobacillus litoralis]